MSEAVWLGRGGAEGEPYGLHPTEKGTAPKKQSPRHGLTEREPHARPSWIQADKVLLRLFNQCYNV
jgi:hypothetical protein